MVVDDRCYVAAVNIRDEIVLLEDGTVCKMASFHEFGTGDEVEKDVADFCTFELPDGKWSYAPFRDFMSASTN